METFQSAPSIAENNVHDVRQQQVEGISYSNNLGQDGNMERGGAPNMHVQNSIGHSEVPKVDLEVSIAVMSLRKSIRRYRGSYKPSQVLNSGVWFAILVWLWGIERLVLIGREVEIDFSWQVTNSDPNDQVNVGVSILFFYAGLAGLAVLLWYQIKREIRESFYVAVACSGAMLAVILQKPGIWWLRNFIMIVYAALMVLVFAYKAFLRNILPMLHKYNSVITRHRQVEYYPAVMVKDPEKYHPLLEGQRVVKQLVDYTTASDWWRSYYCCRRIYQIQYIGMINDKGQPHGFGIWKDNFRFGEQLVGKWHDGRPIGPFKSREWGSGSAFVCRRVAYIQCRGDKLTKFGWYTKLAPLTVGTVAIECSVSGVFYRDYPRVSFLYGPVLFDNPCAIQLYEKTRKTRFSSPDTDIEAGEQEFDMDEECDIQRTNSCGEMDMAKFDKLLDRYRKDQDKMQPTVSYNQNGRKNGVGKTNAKKPQSPHAVDKQQGPQLQQVVEVEESGTSQETKGTGSNAEPGCLQGAINKGGNTVFNLLRGHQENKKLPDSSSSKQLLDQNQSRDTVEEQDELSVVPRRSSQILAGIQNQWNIIKNSFKRNMLRPVSDRVTWLVPGELSEYMDFDQFNMQKDRGQTITITADPERGVKISGFVPTKRTEFDFLPGTLNPTSLHLRIFQVDDQYQSVVGSPTPQQQAMGSSYQFQVIEEPFRPQLHLRSSSLDASHNQRWQDEELLEGMSLQRPPSSKSEQYWIGNINIVRAQSDVSNLKKEQLKLYQSNPLHSVRTVTDEGITSYDSTGLQAEEATEKQAESKYHQYQHSKGEVQIEGWVERTFEVESEALLFIHGYNCSVEHGMKLFGQMIALGNFPAHIRPVVFGWPNSRDWSYYHSQKSCASRSVHLRLLSAIKMLAAEGIHHIHIMSHSMGCRLAMLAVPMLAQALEGDLDDPDKIENVYNGFSLNYFFKYQHATLRQQNNQIVKNRPKRKFKKLNVTIETFTLINPEYSLEDFVNYTGPILRDRVCPIVTIYGDRMDSALSFSETLNGIRRWWRKEKRKPIASPDYLKIYPGYRTFEGSSGIARQLLDLSVGHHIDYIVHPNNESNADSKNQRRSNDYDDEDSGMKYLDIDVISTTYLQGNIHVYRHNYFHLNKEVVEDLRDLVLTKRRAYQRSSRLEHSHGNVYDFMVAPSHVEAK